MGAFLDNTGNIVMDAIITDHGRKVLAKGDGSFQMTKFGLSDDEIDYSLYNKNHPSGSAYYDLEILQTPILQAFTDNHASMKYNLTTYTNMELLFLPILKLNESDLNTRRDPTANVFYVCVNNETENNSKNPSSFTAVGVTAKNAAREGFMFGSSLGGQTICRVDQGLDTTEISATRKIDPDLAETNYVVRMDNRLGNLADKLGNVISPDYVDDDKQAYYTVSIGPFVTVNNNTEQTAGQVIAGPRGTFLEFQIQASMDLNTSDFLFRQLGGQIKLPNRSDSAPTTTDCFFIDSLVSITGMKTGCNISVPIRYVRIIG